MNDPHRRARCERHLRDRSQAMLDRFVERRNRNQRYDNWLERNGLEPGYDYRRSRKPDPVKVKQGIKRETGIYLGQAAHAMENGGIMTAARLDTGSSVLTADCFDTSLRTGYIPSSSPQSSSASSCRHGSDGTSRPPLGLRSWLLPTSHGVSTPSSTSPAQPGSSVDPCSDTTPELSSGSDSAGASSPAALPRLSSVRPSERPGCSVKTEPDFVDLGPGSRDDPFIISDTEDSDIE